MHIAHFGGLGSYTHQITAQTFHDQPLQGYGFTPDVVEAVAQGSARRGVIPLENKYKAFVPDSADALLDSRGVVGIIEELVLPIHHCLGGIKPLDRGIREIRSHEQALMQCLPVLRQRYPHAQLVPTATTAAGAEQIHLHHLEDAVAIASEEALQSQRLQIYARDILPGNATRFGVLADIRTVHFSDSTNTSMRTVLGIYLSQDVPGALHRITAPLAQAGVNMFYINSRSNGQGGYHFFTEVAGTPFGHPLAEVLAQLTTDLASVGSSLAILGVYQSKGWAV